MANFCFFDEVQGRYNIHIDRKPTNKEEQLIDNNYSQISKSELKELKQKLINLDFSEILPYYIMRYGFYKGHTDYSCDPVSIAFIFGLKNIEEIDIAVDGDLYSTLTDHYILR